MACQPERQSLRLKRLRQRLDRINREIEGSLIVAIKHLRNIEVIEPYQLHTQLHIIAIKYPLLQHSRYNLIAQIDCHQVLVVGDYVVD